MRPKSCASSGVLIAFEPIPPPKPLPPGLGEKSFELPNPDPIAAEEFKKHDELLTNLSSSESYEVVQKAKRQKYVVEEWKKKKQSMLDEIDTLSHEYAAFKNEEKSVLHGNITKKAKAADDEFAKAEEKWKEEILTI